MGESNFIHSAVFYSHQSPKELASLISSLMRPVEIPADIKRSVEVANGTALESVKTALGTKTSISVDGIVVDVTVSWGADTEPTYQQATEGTYVLDGTISELPSNIKNSGTYKIKQSIMVAAADE